MNTATTSDADDCALIIIGLEEHQESFTSEKAGTFNVTRARAWANANVEAIDATIGVVDILKLSKDHDSLDSRLMAQLLQKDVQEIIRSTVLLYIVWDDGRHLLIDGHHRLAAVGLMSIGQRSVTMRAQFIPFDKKERFRVRYIEHRDGVAREIAPLEILKTIDGIFTSKDGTIRDERAARHGGKVLEYSCSHGHGFDCRECYP